VIDNDELAKIVRINADGDLPGYATAVIKGLYDVHGGAEALQARLAEIFAEVSAAIAGGARFVVSPTATATATWRRSRRFSCVRPFITT
jgi:glutamate synthase (NADPH/NADH) large chain